MISGGSDNSGQGGEDDILVVNVGRMIYLVQRGSEVDVSSANATR
jgi:hypothetical protein